MIQSSAENVAFSDGLLLRDGTKLWHNPWKGTKS